LCVVVVSDAAGPPFTEAFEELQGSEAVRFAMEYAATKGMSNIAVDGLRASPYAVNADGEVVAALPDDVADNSPRRRIHRYRADFHLMSMS
jgi:hypothetical protein